MKEAWFCSARSSRRSSARPLVQDRLHAENRAGSAAALVAAGFRLSPTQQPRLTAVSLRAHRAVGNCGEGREEAMLCSP